MRRSRKREFHDFDQAVAGSWQVGASGVFPGTKYDAPALQRFRREYAVNPQQAIRRDIDAVDPARGADKSPRCAASKGDFLSGPRKLERPLADMAINQVEQAGETCVIDDYQVAGARLVSKYADRARATPELLQRPRPVVVFGNPAQDSAGATDV